MPGFALAFALSAAVGVEVHLAPDATAAHCLKNGWLIARSSDAEALVRIPVREDQRTYRLQLSGEAVWEITTEAEGCWSETVHSGSDGALTLALHRAATVSGVFESDANAKTDGELRGFVFRTRPGGAEDSPGVNGLATRCKLDFPQWRCAVPADVQLDLRLELRGFGAVHYFAVKAAEGGMHKLAPQRLVPGATLAGWVEDSDGVAVPKAKVTLYPMQVHAYSGETEGLAVRRHVTTANVKGFFQFAGLQPGLYRLVSEGNGRSPVNVPEVRVREGESLVWPRPIVHPPLARLEVLLSPPLDPRGSPWVVELEEKAPLHVSTVPPLQKKASADGRWEAAGLRADAYWLRVRDGRGAPMEWKSIDLGEGGLKTIPIEVRSVAVRGILLMGDEPVSGFLSFSNSSGRDVAVETAQDGSFEAVFATGGRWTPHLEYPRRGDSRIFLEPVNLDPEKAASETLELRVPGSRIRGVVLGPQKTPVPEAVVHLLRTEGMRMSLAADTRTGDDGRFELVAIAPGSYLIQAEGNRIATPRRTPLELKDDETREVTLVLDPTRHIELVILTPHGAPASGAAVQLSPDEGKGWFWLTADVRGRLERSVPSGVRDVPLVIATYGWPSAAVSVPSEMRGPVTIRLLPEGGALRVLNARFPVIRTPDVTAPFGAFKIPPPYSRRDDPALMEPGTYIVCPDYNVPDDACRSVTITAGSQQTVDFAPKDENKEKSGS